MAAEYADVHGFLRTVQVDKWHRSADRDAGLPADEVVVVQEWIDAETGEVIDDPAVRAALEQRLSRRITEEELYGGQ